MGNAKTEVKNDAPTIVDNRHEIEMNSDSQIVNSLKNHLLIAMPSLTDPYFNHSVVYLCEHDKYGAMGFIINFPIKLTVQELLKNVVTLTYQPEPPILEPVFLGGPLELERGFVLHSPVANHSQSVQLNAQLMMSNSNTILSTLGTDKAPEKYLVTLGYASWESGQLEQEIKDNQWLTIESENDIIFNTPVEQRWRESLQRIGITPEQLSNCYGHA